MPKKIRMLVDREIDGVKYKPNQVVIFPEALEKALVNGGEADASKAAVAYCEEELGAKAITHEAAADQAADQAADKLEAELADLRKQHRREKDAEKKAELGKRIAELKAQLEGGQAAPAGGQ
jgi:vacuolar-type H+-ATPase subunit I/STV1